MPLVSGKCLTRSRTSTSGSADGALTRLPPRGRRRRAPPRAPCRPAARPTACWRTSGVEQAGDARGRGRPATGSSGGSMRLCASRTYGQRGWKEHPPGRCDQRRRAPGDRHELLVARRVQPRDRAQQPPRVRVLRARVEDAHLVRALDDPAGVHDGDVVGHLGHHAEVVGDDHDRGVELALQPLDQLEDLRLHGHVERGRGLVGDQQLRVVGQRHGDHRALAHAAGELVRVGRPRAGAARGCRPARASRPRGRSACALETSRCARIASTICAPTL